MTDEQRDSTNDKGPRATEHSHFNPVSVNVPETCGVIFLGIIALTLLIALLRAQARNRQLSESE